jgi:hypothetical protein
MTVSMRGGFFFPKEAERVKLRTETEARGQVEHEAIVLIGRNFGRNTFDDCGMASRLGDGSFGVVGCFGIAGVGGCRACGGCTAVEERGWA